MQDPREIATRTGKCERGHRKAIATRPVSHASSFPSCATGQLYISWENDLFDFLPIVVTSSGLMLHSLDEF